MKKVLIVNIDSILNFHNLKKNPIQSPTEISVDRFSIQNLNEILDIDPEIMVAVYSPWGESDSLESICDVLENDHRLLKGSIVDVIESEGNRPESIRKWIESNQPAQFCILDDEWIFSINDPLLQDFVKLSKSEGLLEKHIDIILSRFID